MRLINIFFLIFLLSAFAVGSSLDSMDNQMLEQNLNNASIAVQNITLESSGDQYMDGMYTILEKFVNFIGVTFIEIMRMGISFGKDNPEYFEPLFIFKIIKLLVWLTIISLLIKPLFYLIILIIMFVMFIVDRIKKKSIKHSKKNKEVVENKD